MGRIYNGMNAAKKLVMNSLGYDRKEADYLVRIALRNDLPALRTKEGAKFIFGATRMFCSGELMNANIINQLNSTLKLVSSKAHIEEYNRNLNGLSAQDIIDRFKSVINSNLKAEKEELYKMEFNGESDYDIVRIDSFEDAKKYGNYTSWCITQEESSFNGYTSNGINQFYFCLHKGFDEVVKVAGANAPLDEYGLSMIAVCVNRNGSLTTCTCRWNHDNGGNDSIMNAKEVSMLINRNFYDVFKQNNLFQEKLDKAMGRLKSGEPLWKCFFYFKESEGFIRIKIGENYNFLNAQKELVSKEWFVGAYNFHDGFAVVECEDGKFNFIDKQGNFLFNSGFKCVNSFSEGYGSVQREDEKWNFIDKQGNLLFNEWFRGVGSFHEGFAAVQRENDKLWNFIDEEGNLLLKKWLLRAGSFYEGFAAVETIDVKANFIDKEGSFLSKEGFLYTCDFNEGFAVVIVKGGNYNFIDTRGKLLLKENFLDVNNFYEGFAVVRRKDGKYNFVNTQGIFLSDEWFNSACDFKEGYASVQREDKMQNLIDKEGKFLSKEWFLNAESFCEGFAVVKRQSDERDNFIDNEGNFLSKEWYLFAVSFFNAHAAVEREKNEYFFIDKQGVLYNVKTMEEVKK